MRYKATRRIYDIGSRGNVFFLILRGCVRLFGQGVTWSCNTPQTHPADGFNISIHRAPPPSPSPLSLNTYTHLVTQFSNPFHTPLTPIVLTHTRYQVMVQRSPRHNKPIPNTKPCTNTSNSNVICSRGKSLGRK